MTIKNTTHTTMPEPQTPGAQPEQAAPVDGHPVESELLMDANVALNGTCIQPGGAEDDRHNTGAPCRNSMDGG